MTTFSWDALHQQHRHQLQYPSEHVVRFLAGLLEGPAGHRLLDIGCGAGRHMKVAAELGFDVVGVDSSEIAVETASQYGETVPGSMDALPFPNNSFDVALAYGVFYYGTVEDTTKAVDEMWRVLRPTGVGLVVLRTLEDWRCGMGEQIAPHTYKLDLPGHPEDGGLVNFAPGARVERLFSGFKLARVELIEHSSSGRLRKDSDWLVIAMK